MVLKLLHYPEIKLKQEAQTQQYPLTPFLICFQHAFSLQCHFNTSSFSFFQCKNLVCIFDLCLIRNEFWMINRCLKTSSLLPTNVSRGVQVTVWTYDSYANVYLSNKTSQFMTTECSVKTFVYLFIYFYVQRCWITRLSIFYILLIFC